MKVLAVIPARYASTRFPGKPLALLGGMAVVEWVWRCASRLEGVTVVATDDERIMKVVESFGGRAMMTSSTHRSGTDRTGEVLERLEQEGERFDVVVNVQGDEPFVKEEQLWTLRQCFELGDTQIATLMTTIGSTEELSPHVRPNPSGDGDIYGRTRQENARPAAEYPRGALAMVEASGGRY